MRKLCIHNHRVNFEYTNNTEYCGADMIETFTRKYKSLVNIVIGKDFVNNANGKDRKTKINRVFTWV